MPVVAETRRLFLSELEEERDFGAVQSHMLAESYWRHLPMEAPTAEWVAEYLREQVRAQDAPRTSYFLAVRHRDDGRFIGTAHLRLWDAATGDIGWAVDEPWRGQGYATEIGAALVHLGFGRHGLHRVCAFCRVGNEASRQVMRKLGMQPEGTIREHVRARGAWWSSWGFSILSDEACPAMRAASVTLPGLAHPAGFP